MSAITIEDLPMNRALDRKALAAIRGGGAPWVYGWIRPFVGSTASRGSGVNFFQINNFFQAEQMINQFQVVEVTNTAAGSTIGVTLDESSALTAPGR